MTDTKELKLQTNLDTNLLKLIAIVCMLVDHIGSVFFPEQLIFRIVGRLAFPLFCYCMTVGLLYTHDIRRYLGRLAIFAIVSQPFWILAFNADDFMGNLFNMNIFFTLFISLLAMWAFKEHKWWLFVLSLVVTGMFNFDYSFSGIILMLIFYLCRKKPALGAALYILSYANALYGSAPGDYFALTVSGNYAVDISIFAVLAAPLIFFKTNSGIKIPKWFFYGFYPAHLLLIYLLQLMI